MKIVICWSGISGYMAACWRALAAQTGVELFVIAFGDDRTDVAFSRNILTGVPHHLLSTEEMSDAERIRAMVLQNNPDVLVISGWFHPPYVRLAFDPQLRSVRKIMGMDTPWRGTLRQHLARYRLRKYLDQIDAVFVAGERAWQYARRLKIAESKIHRGVYGFDAEPLQDLHAKRAMMPEWPRRFLFVGRYVPEKGVAVLLDAYARYRESTSDPWPLTCCGKGPMESKIAGAPGVENRGFVQPSDLPEIFLQHGAFILPSLYEPWGVALAEAAAAGLPVICTESVGASVELVRSYFNGMTIATADAAALAKALTWMHHNHAHLPEMGKHGTHLAAAFTAQLWAQRWVEAMR